MKSLPARSETTEDRKNLEKIILALQTAKKAAKDFSFHFQRWKNKALAKFHDCL